MSNLISFETGGHLQDVFATQSRHTDSGKPLIIRIGEGGGRLGLISALLKEKTAELAGKPTHEIFDATFSLSVSTLADAAIWPLRGTGQPLKTEKEYKDFFVANANEAFRNDWTDGYGLLNGYGAFNNMYDIHNIGQMIDSIVGDLKLSDYADGLHIGVWDLDNDDLTFFSSDEAAQDSSKDFYMRDLLRAAIAFPHGFEIGAIKNITGEERHLRDGGMIMSDPTALAIMDTMIKHGKNRDIIPVTYTTGSSLSLNHTADQFNGGFIKGAQTTIRASNTGRVNAFAQRVAKLYEDNYVRLDVEIGKEVDMFSKVEDITPFGESAVAENQDKIINFLHSTGHLKEMETPKPLPTPIQDPDTMRIG